MTINEYADYLNRLSVKYANRQLPFEQYRQERKEVLDQIEQRFNTTFVRDVEDQTQRYEKAVTAEPVATQETNNQLNQSPLGRFIKKLKK